MREDGTVANSIEHSSRPAPKWVAGARLFARAAPDAWFSMSRAIGFLKRLVLKPLSVEMH